MSPKDHLNRAIKLCDGLDRFAQLVAAPSVHAVKAWRLSGVPPAYCPRIERVTDGAVRCEDLCPDVEWEVLRQPVTGLMQGSAPTPGAAHA